MVLNETVLAADASASFTVSTKALLAAVAFLHSSSRGVPAAFGESVVTIQALAGDSPRLELSTTIPDSRIKISVEASVEVEEEGYISLETGQLFQMLKSAEAGAHKTMISVVDESTARVRIGRSLWSPSLQPRGDWPDDDLGWVGTISSSDVSKALGVVSGAMPSTVGRPALHRVEVINGTAEATDGTLLLKQKIADSISLSIPKPIALQLAKIPKDDEVDFRASDKKFSLTVGALTIVVEKPLSKYPETGKLLAAASMDEAGILLCEPRELLSALKRVRVYADPFDPSVRIRSMKVKDQWTVIMIATDRSGNLSRELLTASWQDSERLDASVDAKRLETFLKAATRAGVDGLTLHVGLQGGALWTDDEESGFSGVLQQMT